MNLLGELNSHLEHVERALNVDIANRGNRFEIHGDPHAAAQAEQILRQLYRLAGERDVRGEDVHLALSEVGNRAADRSAAELLDSTDGEVVVRLRRQQIRARSQNQAEYLRTIESRDLCFGEGPAGTGKTYLAVACAVSLLESEQVRRLVLVRPAVEAGERLGFLPGDLSQKIDPYLRPIYDALYEFLGFERVGKLIDRHVIEVAPLAFMRGRTLNHACVIMDEAQNTTQEQMKMFLTRIGYGSKAIVTGDTSQIDLPDKRRSGLVHAKRVLADGDGVGFVRFASRDVVRHPLVQRIVNAYDADEASGPRAP
ncbi:MAG: PhoH family protein [Pseudomonadota bacterium]